MFRVVAAAFVGALIYFVWQMLTWMVLPIHGPTVAPLPDQVAMREFLATQNMETGVYIVPFADGPEMADPDSEFNKFHAEGPLFSMYFRKEGAQPMSPSLLAFGFLNDIAAALIVALMLRCASGCCGSYINRVLFVTGFGVFLALTGHVSYLIWIRFPMDYSMMFVLDAVFGWFLAGLAIAAIVRGQPQLTQIEM